MEEEVEEVGVGVVMLLSRVQKTEGVGVAGLEGVGQAFDPLKLEEVGQAFDPSVSHNMQYPLEAFP